MVGGMDKFPDSVWVIVEGDFFLGLDFKDFDIAFLVYT